jgi:hypothetical protein
MKMNSKKIFLDGLQKMLWSYWIDDCFEETEEGVRLKSRNQIE